MAHSVSTFRPDSPFLSDLLKEIGDGETQLPDFQRGWVWNDDQIRSLIASVSLSYPIGAVMLLQLGSEGNFRFKPRAVEGVKTEKEPEKLILDGQQRLTSLYLALMREEPVPTRTTKNKEVERHYYLDMEHCVEEGADRYEAVVSLSPDKKVKSDFGRQVDLDLSTREREYHEGFFPLHLIYERNGYREWRRGYNDYFREQGEADNRLVDRFEEEVVDQFSRYEVPVIELRSNTPKEAVCLVFEKVNTGGVSLTVFELVTATFAADDFSLRDDWEARREELHERKTLRRTDATAFLTAVTLLASYRRYLESGSAVSCKRRDILRLTLEDYQRYADDVAEGFQRAARFLVGQNVFTKKNVPYRTQLIPLAVICAALGKRFDDDFPRRKIAQWYWCGVLGEMYGGSTETRFALDVQEVLAWIDGGEEPSTVRDANFAPTRLLSLRTRNSAAYKGVFARLMQRGSEDFLSGDSITVTRYLEEAVDVHHVFPKSYCKQQGYEKDRWNSIVNKSPLTARTNRKIGGDAPSEYLSRLDQEVGEERLDERLATHTLPVEPLREDDFSAFIRRRAAAMLDLISEAMGKEVTGRGSGEVVEAYGGALDGLSSSANGQAKPRDEVSRGHR